MKEMILDIINPQKYYQLFRNVIIFLINPKQERDNIIEGKQKIINSIILFILSFLISLSLIIFNNFILGIKTKNIGEKEFEELYLQIPLLFYFIGAILIPFLEEILWRLSLIFKPIYLSLSIFLMIYYLLTKVFFNTYIVDMHNYLHIRIGIALIIGVISYFIISNFEKKIKIFWSENFRWIYYFSFILFGFMHIFNYELSLKVILLMPLITISQLTGGIFYGYLRVKYGFMYNWVSHLFNNTFPLLFVMFKL